MASLKKIKRSPYWYIRFRDLETGVWRDENTKLRKDNAQDTIKANKECAKRTAAEQSVSPQNGGDFSAWVPTHLKSHYKNPRSLERYEIIWDNISGWLKSKKIRHPREFKYQHVAEYIEWRKQQVKHNTARLEIGFFKGILREACAREFLDKNVISLTRIRIEPAKEKKELTVDEIHKIRLALKSKDEWMGIVFEIMLNLGCRFNETRFSKSRVNFEEEKIEIEDSKRKPHDKRKVYKAPMKPRFVEYLRGLKWENGYTVPEFKKWSNQRFNEVLKAVCGATSHSCRVSFITRCHRAGLTARQTMELVNHSNDEVHKIYSRLNIDDAAQILSRVPAPPDPF
jgi:hypothetical protein